MVKSKDKIEEFVGDWKIVRGFGTFPNYNKNNSLDSSLNVKLAFSGGYATCGNNSSSTLPLLQLSVFLEKQALWIDLGEAPAVLVKQRNYRESLNIVTLCSAGFAVLESLSDNLLKVFTSNTDMALLAKRLPSTHKEMAKYYKEIFKEQCDFQ